MRRKQRMVRAQVEYVSSSSGVGLGEDMSEREMPVGRLLRDYVLSKGYLSIYLISSYNSLCNPFP